MRFTKATIDSQNTKSWISKAVNDSTLEEVNRASHGLPYHFRKAHPILKAY